MDELKIDQGLEKLGHETNASNPASSGKSNVILITSAQKFKARLGTPSNMPHSHEAVLTAAHQKATAEKSFSANVGVNSGGDLNASLDVGFKKTTETEFDGLSKSVLHSELKAHGVPIDKNGIPLDLLAKAIQEHMNKDGRKFEEFSDEQRAKLLEDVSQMLVVKLREEKKTEFHAGFSVGAGASADPRASEQSGHATATASQGAITSLASDLVGGMTTLVSGSAKLFGAAAGAAGRGLSDLLHQRGELPAQRFNGVAILPAISEYRVNQVEKATDNYRQAVESFWKITPMAALRGEIEERARKTGLSVPDAMAKMKPGGEWTDLHEKFVKSVAGSPQATQAKMALDTTLKSYTKQLDRASEELLSADVEANPNLRKAKTRVEATKGKMEELSAQTPVFGGEMESHAERLKAAMQAIVERMREILEAVGRVFSRGAEHATS